MDDILHGWYYDVGHPAGFGTADAIYKAAKEHERSLTRPHVNKWLLKQNVFTLHVNVRRKFERRKIVAAGLHYQM